MRTPPNSRRGEKEEAVMQSQDDVAVQATSSATELVEGNTVPTNETATTSPLNILPERNVSNNSQSDEAIITPAPKNYHIDASKSPGDEHRVSLGGSTGAREQGSPARAGRGEDHASAAQAASLTIALRSPSTAAGLRTPQTTLYGDDQAQTEREIQDDASSTGLEHLTPTDRAVAVDLIDKFVRSYLLNANEDTTRVTCQ